MRKGLWSAYHKWNISVVICDTDFHSGQPSHGGDRKTFEVMNSTLPKGTIGSVASLLAATLYQRNPDRNHKVWNIISSERFILHMEVKSSLEYNDFQYVLACAMIWHNMYIICIVINKHRMIIYKNIGRDNIQKKRKKNRYFWRCGFVL